MLIISWVTCTAVYEVSFWFGSNLKKYLSIDGALAFQIDLDIHLSKMGLKLVYYYLYNVESQFTMYLCMSLTFNQDFYYFCTNIGLIHLSLSWQ